MLIHKKTLAGEARFEGLALHGGEPVVVTVRPGESGIRFWTPNGMVEAKPENVTETRRCTKLGGLSTIEHLMSAFAGLEITDADVEVDGFEMPAMDGAASEYAVGLLRAGLVDRGDVEQRTPFKRSYVVEGEAKVAVSFGHGHWRYEFVSADKWPYSQVFELDNLPAGYVEQIAPARTWGFESELPMLKAAGLAKGLDLEKALVLGAEGYVNQPLFPDEPARHKLLDLMGDLYLAGIPVRYLNVVAERSGHELNVRAAAHLLATMA